MYLKEVPSSISLTGFFIIVGWDRPALFSCMVGQCRSPLTPPIHEARYSMGLDKPKSLAGHHEVGLPEKDSNPQCSTQ